MENQQSSSLTALLHSRRFLLIAGVVIISLLVAISVFFILSSKPPLEPIPEESVYVADEVVVQIAEGYTPGPTDNNQKWEDLYARLQALGVQGYEPAFDSNDPELSRFYKLKLAEGSDVELIREELYELNEIKGSEPDFILHTQISANDVEYSGMWGLQRIDIERAWDITRGSNSVRVAVVDTGVDYNHPDFAGRSIVKGKDVSTCDSTIQELQASGGKCTRPKQPDNDPMDSNGHGTHVAGTIGAATNNGIGIAGVNWNVTILAVKVLGAGGAGGLTEISNGLVEAADSGAKIVNMSLGGRATCSQGSTIKAAIDYARSKGVTVVAAAGNDNIDASAFAPANCAGVLTVGATGPNDERAGYSNYGSIVDIAAPGGNEPRGVSSCNKSNCITSTWINSQYRSVQGTSMAAPHVAGVASLLLAQDNSLTPDRIRQCLINSGISINTDRPVGGKRLNAYGALNGCTANNDQPTTAPVAATATPVNNPPLPDSSQNNTPMEYYLKGFAYFDANRSLTFDSDETMVSGVSLRLIGPSTNNSVTGVDGKFEFRNLQAGSYLLTASIYGRDAMEYRIILDINTSSFNIPIPILDISENTNPDEPRQGENRQIITGTPTPTPKPLHTCVERTYPTRINNRTIQMKYLDCSPK